MAWLRPPNVIESAKISSTDLFKRWELLLEFCYYVFDSLLIPLVRSNFHVTESSNHSYRMFYFRHDIWKALTEPSIAEIKASMFEEMDPMQARQVLDSRALGFGQIRLLPKGTGVRPITNLRRRVTILKNHKAILGRSINSIMEPVFKIFDYERKQNPEIVGSTLLSIDDLYPRLKVFKDRLRLSFTQPAFLYFAKVDVKSCFDTIPQRRVIRMMEKFACEEMYRIGRHSEVKAPEVPGSHSRTYTNAKPVKKFVASAYSPLDFRTFEEIVEESWATGRSDTIFVDSVYRKNEKRQKLLGLLRDHIEQNIVRIGKKFFRQKEGIPQGSVLSSLLCNFFYADLERKRFPFLQCREGTLFRLIDDFLFITTSRNHAEQFLQTMHDGIEEYGVRVNPEKSLVNFEVSINGSRIPRITRGAAFPYCGDLVNTKSLEISKDRDRRKMTGKFGSPSRSLH